MSNDKLQEQNENLKEKYDELKIKYDELKEKHETLQNEYSENVIIQSMNEMKDRYERLVQSSIPNYKYNLLYERYTKIIKCFTACSVLLDYIYKQVKQVDRVVHNTETKQGLHKIEMDLTTTKNILEESLESIKL
jgi:hypothetical protein